MIDRVTIQNYKSLKDVTVTFDSRLTVLVGANGSGKSSVLRCIHALCQMLRWPTNNANSIGEVESEVLMTANDPAAQQLIALRDDQNGDKYEFRYVSSKRPRKPLIERFVHPEEFNYELSVSKNGSKRHSAIDDSQLPDDFKTLNLDFANSETVRFSKVRLAAPSLTDSPRPTLAIDGYGLASVMANFRLSDNARFSEVVAAFAKLVPQVRDIRVERLPIEGGQAYGESLVFDLPNRRGVLASQMSDGQLYALGLIVKILDPQRPKTLLIDDIDHGFHPKAQTQLVELIKKLLDEFPDLQIIATSHSPYILSGLGWDEVRVLHLRDDGTTVVRKLSDHPNYERWHKSSSPGEFWSFAGEEWAEKVPAEPVR